MITQTRLLELFDYSEKGFLSWKSGACCRRWRCKEGFPAGTRGHKKGYIWVCVDRKIYAEHRLVWLYFKGYWPENEIDHINRDRADNRIENLREISSICNCRNKKLLPSNTSGVAGVTLRYNGKYSARISQHEKGIKERASLGNFEDFIEAVAHRLAAEQCLNWDGCDSNSSSFRAMQKYVKGDKE